MNMLLRTCIKTLFYHGITQPWAPLTKPLCHNSPENLMKFNLSEVARSFKIIFG